PNYSDYVSGHAGLTGPACQVIRRTLGEDTVLELRSVHSPSPRVYAHLSDIEHDAFNARIWSGLHFRRAMVDGYDIAHRTAERVMEASGACPGSRPSPRPRRSGAVLLCAEASPGSARHRETPPGQGSRAGPS